METQRLGTWKGNSAGTSRDKSKACLEIKDKARNLMLPFPSEAAPPQPPTLPPEADLNTYLRHQATAAEESWFVLEQNSD